MVDAVEAKRGAELRGAELAGAELAGAELPAAERGEFGDERDRATRELAIVQTTAERTS